MTNISPPQTSPEEPLTFKERLSAVIRVIAMIAIGSLVVLSLLPDPSPVPLQSQAPAIQLTSYDGKKWDLQRFQGSPILLNFWGSWCAPCLHEIPALSAAAQQYKEDVVFIGAAVNSPPQEAIAVVNKFSIPYIIAAADSGTIRRWGAEHIPITFLLDSEHRVVWTYRGALGQDDISEAIDTFILKPIDSSKP